MLQNIIFLLLLLSTLGPWVIVSCQGKHSELIVSSASVNLKVDTYGVVIEK